MGLHDLEYIRIEGKTYSLFGNSTTTTDYYSNIKIFADIILDKVPDIESVYSTLIKHSSKKHFLKNILKKHDEGNLISECLWLINEDLKQYTQTTDKHLKSLPKFKIWDRRLATTREQYHLYMLEIELTNRMFSEQFKNTTNKIALLPYCLQDFTVECKAAQTDFDYTCRHCSTHCFQNRASTILKKQRIEPYIWMGGNLKKLAKKSLKNNESLGVLGIACIPELVWGMRKCRKAKIPVVGIPLNANRCIRWFGEFHQNSIDLDELEKLVS